MSAYVRLLPVLGLPDVEPGDDLAALLAAHADLAEGDVLVVAQKVVSKAEGRLVPVASDEDPVAARRRLARAEARRIVADTPWVLITETRQGFVCANGGVDASNVSGGRLALLPEDADASARTLRAGIGKLTGLRVGIVVADTFGRPWRVGQTDVAIGVAGLAPVRDERGGRDRYGLPLVVTEPAVADELAAAADLIRRKAEGVPAVVVRGLDVVTAADGPGAAALVRPAEEDLFRRGAGQLAAALAGDRLARAGDRLARAGDRPAHAHDRPVRAGDRPVHAPAAERPVPERAVPEWIVEQAQRAAHAVTDATATRLDGVPLRLAVDGEPVAAGVAAGLLVAVLVDGGALAVHRRPAAGEPGVVVVEAGWDPGGARR